MAVVNRNSTQVANIVATPRVALDPADGPARLREVIGQVAPAADDSATSVGRFFRLPSNARVSQLLISAADATTAGAIDIGLYRTAGDGGAVVDADFFASAFDLSGGPFSNAEVTYESLVVTVANQDKTLWEALGLSEDPKIEYDVAYTITTTFNGGPTAIALKGRYVQ